MTSHHSSGSNCMPKSRKDVIETQARRPGQLAALLLSLSIYSLGHDQPAKSSSEQARSVTMVQACDLSLEEVLKIEGPRDVKVLF